MPKKVQGFSWNRPNASAECQCQCRVLNQPWSNRCLEISSFESDVVLKIDSVTTGEYLYGVTRLSAVYVYTRQKIGAESGCMAEQFLQLNYLIIE